MGANGLTSALTSIDTTAGSTGASATQRASRMGLEVPTPGPVDTTAVPTTLDVPTGESADDAVRRLSFPVDVTGGKLVMPNGFGGNSVTRGSGRHNGTDIGEGCFNPSKRPLLACSDAVFVDTSFGSSFGLKITLADGFGNYFHYHHMDSITEGLELGDTVAAGQVVGFMGSSGNTQWAHLHFEVWVGGLSTQRGGRAVDPDPWLPLPIEGVSDSSIRCD